MLKNELKMSKDNEFYFEKAMNKLVKLENILGQYPKWVLETVIGYEGYAWVATVLEREGFDQIDTDTGEPLTKEEYYINFYNIDSPEDLNIQYEKYLYDYMDMVDFIINYRIEKEGLFDIEPIAYMNMTNWTALYIYDIQGDYVAVGYSLEDSKLVPLNYIDNCSFVFNGDRYYLDEFLKIY